MYFFLINQGKWENKHVMGIKQDDGTYAADYEVENVFDILYASDNVLVAHNNVDEHGKKTVLTGLFVKPNIEEEGLQKFQELMEEKGTDEKKYREFHQK
uniref:Lipocalin/cytosolic fatty-acid binding domain-containing protein n=1 Tax=Capra hircus TaxID=9925 RepID=A0A452FZ66_CAPHI